MFGEKFTELKKKAGLTDLEIATELGYTSHQFVYNWRKNKSLPPQKIIPKLAEILGVSPQDLMKLHKAQRILNIEMSERYESPEDIL